MGWKNELVADLSQVFHLPVVVNELAGEKPVRLEGVVARRERPFASDEANAPYRKNAILTNVMRTLAGETSYSDTNWLVPVNSLKLNILQFFLK